MAADRLVQGSDGIAGGKADERVVSAVLCSETVLCGRTRNGEGAGTAKIVVGVAGADEGVGIGQDGSGGSAGAAENANREKTEEGK